jgi:outer membrane receptor protein involved in Fe transport
MIKRAASAVLGLLGFCLPIAAQQTTTDFETITPEQLRHTAAVDTGPALTLDRPDIFSTLDASVLIHGLPVLTLLDGRRFPLSSRVDPLGLFPVSFLTAVEVQKLNPSPVSGTDAPGGVVDLKLNRNYYGGGEFGVFYGKSGGKFGREDFQSYIIGGVVNDHFNITAGAAYQDSSGSIPRRGR